jgi:hypothetical protein
MKKTIALILLVLASSNVVIAANHQMVFVGTGSSRDNAERNAKDQANPHGGVGSIIRIETKKTAPNMWMCVLTAKVSN